MSFLTEFPLPAGLTRLLTAGIWPSTNGPSMMAQHIRPIVAPGRVRRFAAEETLICLQPPPFPTIAREVSAAGPGAGQFWRQFGALHQIIPAKAVIIADFGIGSDAPVILDYAADTTNPPVLRLRWGPDRNTEWVLGARDFDEFADMLGLTGEEVL